MSTKGTGVGRVRPGYDGSVNTTMKHPTARRFAAGIAVLGLTFGAAACSDDDGDDDDIDNPVDGVDDQIDDGAEEIEEDIESETDGEDGGEGEED